MKSERQRLLEKEIARVLDNAAPYLLLEGIIVTTINLTIVPLVTLTEFESVLVKMESQRFVKRVDSNDGRKVKLTDEGRAELLN